MRGIKATLGATVLALLCSSALFVASASATFEATMVPRKAEARTDGPSFLVEAGGGRRTRIRNLSVEAGACGSIYAPLLNAGREKGGFAAGKGAATFTLSAQHLHLQLELKVSPHGEGLRAHGVLQATVGECSEKVPLDLVSAEIHGGGRKK